MNDITVHIYKGLENIEKLHKIRREVFIKEQNVSEEIEIDGEDYRCVHIALEKDDIVIATARLINKPNGLYIGRVAVLKDYRGLGLGKKVMMELHKYLKNENVEEVYLNAQIQVIDFYKSIGYEEISDFFVEANIKHKKMIKKLI